MSSAHSITCTAGSQREAAAVGARTPQRMAVGPSHWPGTVSGAGAARSGLVPPWGCCCSGLGGRGLPAVVAPGWG